MARTETAAHGRMRPRPTLRQRVFDIVETVFGPDPGLIRLVVATRAVVAAAMTLTIMLLLTGGASRPAICAIALGFMISILSNVAVRGFSKLGQATTMTLMLVPQLAAVAIASWLTAWQWIADIGFVVVVTVAVLARAIGPRAMAFGMIAYIGYFIGEVIRPPLSGMPLVVLGPVIGLVASLLARFLLFPDRPATTLRRLRGNIERRIARIVASAWAMLDVDRDGRPIMPLPKRERRLHYEAIRLNEAFVIAGTQVDGLDELPDEQRAALNGRLFDLELTAERLIRIAAADPQIADRARARRRLTELHRALVSRTALPRHRDGRDSVERAVNELERALGAVVWDPGEIPARAASRTRRLPFAERRHA